MSGFADDLKGRVRYRAAEIAGAAREDLERELQRAAPVGTPTPYQTHEPGMLRDSVAVNVRFDQTIFTFTAVATAEHASFTNMGTNPHPIVVVRARALRFDWPRGGLHPAFFHHVSHPGSQATHWFDNTLARWPEILQGAQ